MIEDGRISRTSRDVYVRGTWLTAFLKLFVMPHAIKIVWRGKLALRLIVLFIIFIIIIITNVIIITIIIIIIIIITIIINIIINIIIISNGNRTEWSTI